MTENETIDAKKLNEKCDAIRKSAFSQMLNITRMKPEDIKHTGYKTKEDAFIGIFKRSQREIDKLTDEFFKAYPDDLAW